MDERIHSRSTMRPLVFHPADGEITRKDSFLPRLVEKKTPHGMPTAKQGQPTLWLGSNSGSRWMWKQTPAVASFRCSHKREFS